MNKYRMLNLGDSYTIGEAVSSAENFPNQLATHFKIAAIEISIPEIIATTGWTTNELLNGIAKNPTSPPYDIVTLLIGVNNQYRENPIDEYRKEFLELLNISVKNANNKPEHVIVISIPDWGAMPFAEGKDRRKIAEEIDAFNRVNEIEAKKSRCEYCNITFISRTAIHDLSLVASDGLHPSAKQYDLWVDKIFPIASKILSE